MNVFGTKPQAFALWSRAAAGSRTCTLDREQGDELLGDTNTKGPKGSQSQQQKEQFLGDLDCHCFLFDASTVAINGYHMVGKL